MPGELELIERIRRALPSRSRHLVLGIGDDAALLRTSAKHTLVLTCDQFLEGSHFIVDIHPPEVVGYKALARATSDLAAMGARPVCFLMTLALPVERTRRWLDGFLHGMARAAREFKLILAGGDTARSSKILISLTVLGEVNAGRAVTRAGARPGDFVYVSGTLGEAQLGLELILRGLHRKTACRGLLRSHFYPKIQLNLGAWLAEKKLASAMIDTSDGLSTDLTRLCVSSSVGARIYEEWLPRVSVPAALKKRGLDPLALALHGGEDYQLLFTVPPNKARRLPARFDGTRLTRIGEVTRTRGLQLVHHDGRIAPLMARGWDHFR